MQLNKYLLTVRDMGLFCTCPFVINFKDNMYRCNYVECTQLQIFVDIYWTTAKIHIKGVWQDAMLDTYTVRA